jgi:hypothetical protein
MNIVLYSIAGVVAFLALLAWCIVRLHYRIGSRYLKILLFGIPLRRIPLEQIANISKRPPKGLAEYWHNCFKSHHRVLNIELKRGIRRYISITPRNRYIFLADLKSAVRRVDPTAEWADTTGLEDAAGAIDTTGEKYREEADRSRTEHKGGSAAPAPTEVLPE